MNQALILAVAQHAQYLQNLRLAKDPVFRDGPNPNMWKKVRFSSYKLARTLSPLVEDGYREGRDIGLSVTTTCAKAALDALEAEILALDMKYGMTHEPTTP